ARLDRVEGDMDHGAVEGTQMVRELPGAGTNGEGLNDQAVEVLDEQRHAALTAHAHVRVMAHEGHPERAGDSHAPIMPATAARSRSRGDRSDRGTRDGGRGTGGARAHSSLVPRPPSPDALRTHSALWSFRASWRCVRFAARPRR